VYASLPLGEGIILDPFSGSGSTIAATEAMGLLGLGIERHPDYYRMSLTAAPELAELQVTRSSIAQCELDME
jgi:site-specific DNA-methyltransferase (adenine-specific)